jgi:Rod binding domain-containing protein
MSGGHNAAGRGTTADRANVHPCPSVFICGSRVFKEQAMTISNLPQGFSFAPAGTKIDAPAAAREFEALLIAGLLKTARQAGEALGTASTQAGAEGYVEIAEEHVARVMAQRGAFGISQILLKKLDGGGPEARVTEPGVAVPGAGGDS